MAQPVDLDWSAFEREAELLRAREAWTDLERLHRRMLHAVVIHTGEIAGRPAVTVQLELWRSLGTIYAERLDRPESAIDAFKAALSCGADGETCLRLARNQLELGQEQEAVDSCDAALAVGFCVPQAFTLPLRVHVARGDLDRAYCARSCLQLWPNLEIDEAISQRLTNLGASRLRAIAAPMNTADWASLAAPLLTPQLLELLSHATWPRPAPTGDTRVVGYAARALGVPLESTGEPLGAGADLDAADGALRTQLFAAGRELAFFKLGKPRDARDVHVLLLALARLVGLTPQIPTDLSTAVQGELHRLASATTETQRARISEALQHQPVLKPGEVYEALESCACRAGLLLAQDFRVVIKLFHRHGDLATPGPLVRDLCAFMVSASHSKLRWKLGFQQPATRSWAERLRDPDPAVVGKALCLSDQSGHPDELLPILTELLSDDRVYRDELPAGPTYDAICALAVRAIARYEARGVRVLQRARESTHQLTVPVACYDQGAYIGDYSTEVVSVAHEAAQALKRLHTWSKEPLPPDDRLLEELAWLDHFQSAAAPSVECLLTLLGITLGKRPAEHGVLLIPEETRWRERTRVLCDWSIHHDAPTLSGAQLAWRGVTEASVDYRISFRELAEALVSKFGPSLPLDGMVRFGPCVAHSLSPDSCRVTAYRQMPDWAFGKADAKARTSTLERLKLSASATTDVGPLPEPSAGSGVLRVDSEGSWREYRLVPPIPASELGEVFGFRALVIETTTVHASSWLVRGLVELDGVVRARPLGLGSRELRLHLAGAPTGARVEGYPGPPGGSYRVTEADSVNRLEVGPLGSWTPTQQTPMASIASRIRSMPEDWAARAELFRLLSEAGRAVEARFVARATDLLRRLEAGDNADLELGLRELAGMSALVDPALAATAGQGREGFPCLDLIPFSLHYRAEMPSEAPVWDYKPLLPFRVLVIGDFSGTPLPRPLQDIRPTRVTRESFHAARTQVAGNATRDVSPNWRALWWLLERAGAAVQVDLLPCSLADLREDFDDSPQVSRSGLRWILRSKNHLGMDPYGLVVLSDFVDPAAPGEPELLTRLAAVGLDALVPIVTGAQTRREAPLFLDVGFDGAPYLALCAEPFRLSDQDAAPLNGSFLAASLICERFASNAWGGPLRGQIAGVELCYETAREIAAKSHLLSFRRVQNGAALETDSSCARRIGETKSLSWTMLFTRLAHLALDIHLRAFSAARGEDPHQLCDRINRGLTERLRHVDGIQVKLSTYPSEKPDILAATLSVRLLAPFSAPLMLGERLELPLGT